MKIGVIGVGMIGGTIAKKLVECGHDVLVANSRGVEAVQDFARSIGATATDVHGAVRDVDAVIASIPILAFQALPAGLFNGLPTNVPIVDTSNYFPIFNPSIPEIDAGKTEAVWVSEQLAHPVIKAMNNIGAPVFDKARPCGDRDRVAFPVAGDSAHQKKVVMELIDGLGFDALDIGDLDESWRQQPSTPAAATDYGLADLRRAIASAEKGVAPAKRDSFVRNFQAIMAENPTHDGIVTYLRRTNPITI